MKEVAKIRRITPHRMSESYSDGDRAVKQGAFIVHEFDKCFISSKDSRQVVEGFVHEYESGIMKIYTQGKSADFLIPSMKVYINVYNNVMGECKYVGDVKEITFNNIKLVNVSLISSIQKRDNTRVNKQLKYRITHSYNDKKEKIKLDRPVDITVLNISAQGVCFNCEERFEPGFRFPLVFREATRNINLIIEIVRREEYTRSYNYGCKFMDISEKDMDDIFRFVLKEQIAQRRKRTLL